MKIHKPLELSQTWCSLSAHLLFDYFILSSEVQTKTISFFPLTPNALCLICSSAHSFAHHIAVQLVSISIEATHSIEIIASLYSQKFHNESSKFQTKIEI